MPFKCNLQRYAEGNLKSYRDYIDALPLVEAPEAGLCTLESS